jgi:hypothetical protein
MLRVRVSTLCAAYTVERFSYSFDFKHFRCYFYVVTGATAALKRKGNFQQFLHLILVLSYQCIVIINWQMLLGAKVLYIKF